MYARRFLTLAVCGLAAPAAASPRSDPTTGRAVFTGATSASASSIALNPGALGVGPVGEILIAASGTLDRLAVTPTGGSRVTSTTATPGLELGVIYRTGDSFTVGIDARTAPAEVFPAGEQAFRYHTLGGRQRNYVATIAASFRVTNKLFVGASISHDNTLLRLRYARDVAAANGEAEIGGDEAAEVYDVKVRSPWFSTSNLRLNLGLVAQVYRDVWLGVAYHAPPGLGIESVLDGTTQVTLAPRVGGDTVVGNASVLVSFPASVDAELRARLPRAYELRIGGRWEDLSRFTAYDVRIFNRGFSELGIPEWTRRARGLHDTFAVWGGVEQIDEGQALRWGARIGVETSAVDDARTSPQTISPTSFTTDVGGSWRFAGNWMVMLSYGLQVAPSVDASTSEYSANHIADCIASNYDYSTPACTATRDGYAIGSATGEYARLQQSLRLALRYELP